MLAESTAHRKKNRKKMICVYSSAIFIPALFFTLWSSAKASNEHPDAAIYTVQADNKTVQRMIAGMSDKEKIGQLVMPSARYKQTSIPSAKVRKLIQEYYIGSVINYGNADAKTMAIFNNQLQKWASKTRLKIPLFISADLEYGSIQLVTDGTDFPRQMAIGATRDLGTADKAAKINAIESKSTGFNWNYSPLADVNTNEVNPVIGVRSYGENPKLVSEMTAVQIKAYQKQGILATAKHFPGHGETRVDSHKGLASVEYDRKTLEDVHLPPFKAAIEAGVDSIMTAHVIIKAIDPKQPATLSKKVLTGLLRKQMGYDGIIVTDAMSMDAIDQHWGTGQASVMAINAGADIVMATGTYEQQLETWNALYQALHEGKLSKKRVDESLRRILSAKLKYNLYERRYVDPIQAEKTVHIPAHKKAAAEAAEKSITLLKNKGVLPYNPKDHKTTLVVGPMIYGSKKYINAIAESADNKADGQVLSYITSENSTAAEIVHAAALAKKADRIIAVSYSASTLPKGQIKLVKAMQTSGKPVAVLSLGLPYDIKYYPEAAAYLAAYSIDRWGSPVPSSWKAAVDVIFGTQPGGRLPVNIKGFYPIGAGIGY